MKQPRIPGPVVLHITSNPLYGPWPVKKLPKNNEALSIKPCPVPAYLKAGFMQHTSSSKNGLQRAIVIKYVIAILILLGHNLILLECYILLT